MCDDTHDSSSYVALNLSQINERWVNINNYDSASYVASNSSRINKNSARYSQSDIAELREAILEFQRTLVKGVEESHAKLCTNFVVIRKRSITCESSAMNKKKRSFAR